MSDLTEILREEYEKGIAEIMDPHALMEMIEAVMSHPAPKTLKEQGAKTRERVLRLPNIMATEITVGQKPSSEDRQQFQLWMSNIGMSGDASSSAVNQKLTALTDFFDNPKENLKGTTIPETLSYLMFLNQFVYMLKEFNASVAGFLWEPFLAALFGGKSRQVPTSEGDIADIRIDEPGGDRNKPISLKILNEVGLVKGSFVDLVKHFAGTDGKPPGTEMRYIIVVKHQTKKAKAVSAVTFYEFNIAADNFFEWIGNVAYTQTVISKDKAFKVSRDLKEKWLKKVSGTSARIEIEHALPGATAKGPTGKVSTKFVPLAYLNKEEGAYIINPEVAEAVNLRLGDGTPVREGVFDENTNYIAAVAEFKAGGAGGRTMQKGYEAIPGSETKDTVRLWGGKDELAAWSDLATRLQDAGQPPAVFFKAVLGIDPGVPWPGQAALGARRGAGAEAGGTQFHISPAHYKGLGGKLGTLRITTQAVEKFFAEAAATLNEELVTMFNKLADLNDNIGRFFLANCGQEQVVEKCTDKDAANRTEAGQNAINDSKELEAAVVKSVSGMQENT